jgi:thiol-disulfide isomerase/thioredoxin
MNNKEKHNEEPKLSVSRQTLKQRVYEMKRIPVIILLLSSTFLFPLIYTFAQSTEDILARVEQNIRNTTLLSYRADYQSTNSSVNDSVVKASGTIWLKKVSSDRIFGAYFHLNGEDGIGKVDYFYDGQNSFEIRHEDKKMNIFHPHDYPNTPNNPAKARTALFPFQELLIDNELKNTILKNHSKMSLNDNKTSWIITLTYPANEYGQEVTKSLEIDKSTFQIHRIGQEVKWRGVTSVTQVSLSNYQRNDSSIADKIFMLKNYDEYSKEELNIETASTNNPYENFIGKPAPAFSFTSFSGDEVSLNQFKGKVVLLDFWECWCGHCLLAMPKLNRLQRQWKDGLTIIGIVTENKQAIETLFKKNGLIYTNIFANRDILEDYHVSGRPMYVLIDQEGIISTVTLGDLDTMDAKIHRLLK